MFHDAEDTQSYDMGSMREEEHDQVGTVEVQILLSWFFESATPTEVALDLRHAA